MLYLIPKPIHRLAYRFAYQARGFVIRLTRAQMYGCSLVLRDGEGRVLLVRHTYGVRSWTVPGGGMRKGEDPLVAAARELREELRCTMQDPAHIGTFQESFQGGTNMAHVVTGLVEGEPSPDLREIMEARFFHRDDLPDDISSVVVKRLAQIEGA